MTPGWLTMDAEFDDDIGVLKLLLYRKGREGYVRANKMVSHRPRELPHFLSEESRRMSVVTIKSAQPSIISK